MGDIALDEVTQSIKSDVIKDYYELIYLIRDNIEKQKKLIYLYSLTSHFSINYVDNNFTTTAFGALYKNCISLYSIFELTMMGLYGSARIIFRNVFEYQILAKAVAITDDNSVLEKWSNGRTISLKRDVFSKIIHPKSESMKELWDIFNKFTHGTIYSQQVSLTYGDIKNEIEFNLCCILTLLITNYHITNTYVASQSVKYHTRYYMDTDDYKMLNNDIKYQIKRIKSLLSGLPKNVIKDFCSRWIFK